MVDNERPTTPPTGEEKREPPQGSTVQPAASSPLLAWLQGEAARSVVADMVQDGNIKPEHQDEAKKVTAEVSVVVAELKKVARGEKPHSDYAFLPKMTQEILARVDLGEGDIKKVPLLVVLLEKSAQSPLDTAHDIEELMGAILKLKTTDPELAKKILSKLSDRAQGLGIKEAIGKEVRERVEAFIEPSVVDTKANRLITDLTANQAADEFNTLGDQIGRRIVNLELTRDAQERIERAVIEQYKAPDGTVSASAPRLSQAVIEEKQKEIRSTVYSMYEGLTLPGGTAEERSRLYSRFKEYLDSLVSQQLVNRDELHSLQTSVNRQLDLLGERSNIIARLDEDNNDDGNGGRRRRAPVYYDEQGRPRNSTPYLMGAFDYARIPLAGKNHRMARALSDYDNLVDVIKEYYISNNTFEWEKFYADVKDLFDEVLSVLEVRPHEPYKNALNSFYEGHVLDLMITQLKRLGRDISQKRRDGEGDEALPDNIKTTMMMFNQFEGANIEIPSDRRGVFRSNRTIPLESAVGQLLVKDMVDWIRLTEYFQDIGAIAEMGLGFEQLKNYSENMPMSLLDWLWQDKELVRVYNLFIRNLHLETGLNNHIAPQDFGYEDRETRLDRVGTRTWLQLVAQAGEDIGEAAKDKLRRKVRMAAGISKGANGEYWTSMLAARMPLAFKKDKDTGMWRIDRPYTGTHASDFEKMGPSLDIYLTLERFGVPEWIDIIGYMYQPRNLDHHAKLDYGFIRDHTKVYWVRDQMEHAMFAGYKDEFADFQDNYVTWRDMMYTESVGTGARGGWRYEEIRALIEKTPTGEINFDLTMNKLKRVGTYLVKKFIDENIKQFATVTFRDKNGQMITRSGEQLEKNEKEREQAIRYLYEQHVFNRTIDIFPSLFLRFERRQFTPEEEKMIRTTLARYLENQLNGNGHGKDAGFINTHLMPIFASGLGMIEQKVWEKRREMWDQNSNPDGINYELTEQMIFDSDNVNILKRYFKEQQRLIGKMRDKDATSITDDLTDVGEDEFIDLMRGFFTNLKQSLGADRFTKSDRKDNSTQLKGGISERLAKMLFLKQGRLDYDIGGTDFDFSEFMMMGGGKREIARYMGETFAITSEFNTAQVDLVNSKMMAFAKGNFRTHDQIHKGAKSIFGETLAKMRKPILMMNEQQALDYMERTIIFLTNTYSVDGKYRGPWGDVLRYLDKQGPESINPSHSTEYFTDILKRPTTIFGTDGVSSMAEALSDEVDIPFSKEKTKRYRHGKFLGIFPTITRDTEPRDHHVERIEKALGLTKSIKFGEIFSPAALVIIAFILMVLAKLGYDATKQKNQ